MTLAVSLSLFSLLIVMAGLCAFWAQGAHWPFASAPALASWVVGDAKATGMPPPQQMRMLALWLALAALTMLALGLDLPAPLNQIATYAGAGFCGLFATRGIVGFLPFWRRRYGGQPFAVIDGLIYSPGCILIAQLYFTLVVERF
jgi:hypothetical protein